MAAQRIHPMRAMIYCRVSTAGQEDNSSLETQEASCRQHAAERGWEIVGVYRDIHTGAELFERPRLGQMRQLLRSGEASVVVAHALDRVSRSQAHLGFLLSEWDHQGIELALVTESLTDSPEGRLLQSVRSFVAEVERMKISERTQRGIRDRVSKGRPLPGPKAPYGYRWSDKEKTRYLLNEEEASVVRRIFRGILESQSLRSTAMGLTAEGIRTPTGRSPRWEVATLHAILANPVYTGKASAFRTHLERRKGSKRVIVRPEEDWVALPNGVAPQIVSELEFSAVQERLKQNKAAAPRNNANPEATLLRCGFARCGYCGRPLSITKRKDRPHLYRCHPVGRDRHGCPSFGISAPILDNAVWEIVEAVLTSPEQIAAEVDRQEALDTIKDDIVALDRRIADIEKQRTRLARAVATLDDDLAMEPLLNELQILATQARALASERADLANIATNRAAHRKRIEGLMKWCSRVAENLPKLTYDEKRLALEALGVTVKVYRADHEPRWEMTMLPTPFSSSEQDPFVFSNSTASTTGIRRSMSRASTA